MLSNNLQSILNQLPQQVSLLAVSKTKSAQEVLQLVQAGQLSFGENYLNEAIAKINLINQLEPQLANQLQWHFIGHLQSNKAKLAVQYFDSIDSVDSLKLALSLNRHAATANKQLAILLQLKVSQQDHNKYGIAVNDILEIGLEIAQQCSNLKLQGLMLIHDLNQDPQQQFTTTQEIFKQLQQQLTTLGYQGFNRLSMGMSDSLELAIAAGSTQVRIGTALFGARP